MISYNTSTKKITVTTSTSTRAMYDDVQTTFAGSSYMQYQIPMVWNIKDALYTLANGWYMYDATSLGYLYNWWLIDTAVNNRWTNAKTISWDSFTWIQLYYDQTWTPTNFGTTWLINQLLQVRNGWVDINSQAYTVYQRTYGRVYSQFTVTASSWWIDTIPLSNTVDSQITISQWTVDAYTDLSIKWTGIYRSAFDWASTTKYTLNGSITNSDATITVNEAIDSWVPSSWTLQIDSEVISYTWKTTYTFTWCTRWQYQTTAASHSDLANLSTNTKSYSILIKTTDNTRRLNELYNWVQSRLTKATDIDALSWWHIGKLTPALATYTGTMVTATWVWVEWFSALDNNSIVYTDWTGTAHTPPATVAVTVNIDASVVWAQVYVAELDTPWLTDATYTPANIVRTLINETSVWTATSISLTYLADTPVRVVVRHPWYQQFSLYTTITSTWLSVSSINWADSTY